MNGLTTLFPDTGHSIYIYGAGEYGEHVYRNLVVSGYTGIVGFIDTHKIGEKEDLPIFSFSEFQKNKRDNYVIFIASTYDEDIEENLIRNNEFNYILDPFRLEGIDIAAASRHESGKLDSAQADYEEALRRLQLRETYMEGRLMLRHRLGCVQARLLHGLAAIDAERGDIAQAAARIDRANHVDPSIVSLSLIGYERLKATCGEDAAQAFLSLVLERRDRYRADQQEREVAQLRQQGNIDYPVSVIIETLAKCNARCVFCPYTEIARQGEMMPDALLDKLIDEMAAFPPDIPLRVVPYGVNEPFLDNRLYDFIARVNERVPHAGVTIATNGSTLTDRNIDRLCRLRIDSLNVSLNDYRPDEYQRLMGLPFDRTLRNLQALHRRSLRGELPFPVTLSRAGDNTAHDFYFAEWVRRHFPAFVPGIAAMADWLGQVDIPVGTVPSVGCAHWFEMVIRANGDVAFCCADGKTEHPVGNITGNTLLDVYNRPFLREMRRDARDRTAIHPCDHCTKVE